MRANKFLGKRCVFYIKGYSMCIGWKTASEKSLRKLRSSIQPSSQYEDMLTELLNMIRDFIPLEEIADKQPKSFWIRTEYKSPTEITVNVYFVEEQKVIYVDIIKLNSVMASFFTGRLFIFERSHEDEFIYNISK